MTNLESLLILNATPGLGNMRIRKLIEHFGSAEKALNLAPKEFAIEGVPKSILENISRFPKDQYLKDEFGLVEKHGVKVISFTDKAYPKNLKEIPDAPVLLYVKGKLKKENNLAVAMVGSRRASIYGLSVAEKFSTRLAELGITIVSGMALGIDTVAHRGALKTRGATIAVLGNGLKTIYPPENEKLFDEIADTGAVVSEFSMATPAAAYNFPRRNRIISGLSLGVVVVEASAKSGALITSRFALEQGREVFAVPGKVDSPNSQGVHHLIKEGAKLVNNVEDILEELAPALKHHLKKDDGETTQNIRGQKITFNLSGEESSVYEHIRDEAVHIDEIANETGCSVPQTMNALLKLELKHLVRQLPGKRFVRTEGK